MNKWIKIEKSNFLIEDDQNYSITANRVQSNTDSILMVFKSIELKPNQGRKVEFNREVGIFDFLAEIGGTKVLFRQLEGEYMPFAYSQEHIGIHYSETHMAIITVSYRSADFSEIKEFVQLVCRQIKQE